jgi:hypothetical protein
MGWTVVSQTLMVRLDYYRVPISDKASKWITPLIPAIH